jgi:hypothetical protein
MPGLDPGIHSVTMAIIAAVTEWMPWSSHGIHDNGDGASQPSLLPNKLPG